MQSAIHTQLILVDENDRPIGSADKQTCHDGEGLLHRAFSVFLFDEQGRLLLQQRSADKRLWPGYWSNSCCSHPGLGETLTSAVQRRLREELGVAVASVSRLYSFQYAAKYKDLGQERELCHVFFAKAVSPLKVNSAEVAAVRWLDLDSIDHEIAAQAELFTPWFKMEWREIRRHYLADLRRFAA